MRTDRRGLTVIELVLILLALGLIIFFLMRRGGDDAPAPTADSAAVDSTAAAPTTPPAPTAPSGGAAIPVDRLALATPLDSTAAAGDTLEVRVRATTATGTTVVGAAVRAEVDGGGRVEPATATTDALGEATVRWVLGDTGTQTLRASVEGSPAATLTTTVRVGAGAAGGR